MTDKPDMKSRPQEAVMQSELGPCPFCGGNERGMNCLMGSWTVGCSCGVIGGEYETEAEAIAAWNTRFVPRVAGPYDGLVERLNSIGPIQARVSFFNTIDRAAAAIASLQAELAEAREALKPFAGVDLTASGLPDDFALHVLRARAALGDKQ